MSVQDRIREQVTTHPVVLYMKGSPQFPQCGFSATATQLLKMSGAQDIFTVDVTTGALERLTMNRTGDWAANPVWSPEGRQIAYSFVTYADGWNPDGRSGIYVTNRDGSPPWRVTTWSGTACWCQARAAASARRR